MHVGITSIHRRTLLKGATFGTALAFTPAFYREALLAPAVEGDGPYGPLREPDANGVRLPEGFTSRVIAQSGLPVVGIGALGQEVRLPYVWHTFPDGAACYPEEDGGWRYVCNSEVPGRRGGVGAIRFAPDGSIVSAYPTMTGTSSNCAGGATPWGTWLTCEEAGDLGQVWETAPDGSFEGRPLPMLGSCNHEAVAVDPVNRHLFLTEDNGSGLFYRYVPTTYPRSGELLQASLPEHGTLQAARLDEAGNVTWLDVPDPTATPLRRQVEGTPFRGAEGIWYDSGHVYFTTKGDDRVWVHDIDAQRITVLYDPEDFPDAPLTGVDNVTIAPSGDVLVAEDGGDLEIRLIAADTREVAALVQLPGGAHAGSEITGPCFSPDGTRLYFSSQRGGLRTPGLGITFEITGPFRQQRAGVAATGQVPERFDRAPHSPARADAYEQDSASQD
jgi:uncharacterized protein